MSKLKNEHTRGIVMNKKDNVVYIFPAYYLMIPLLIGVVLISAFAYDVIHPACNYLKANSVLVSLVLAAVLAMIGVFIFGKTKSIKLGIGSALAVGQFLLLLVLIMFEIASVSDPNKVDVFSVGATAIVSLLWAAYGGFNCKMVIDAFNDSVKNKNALLIVGIVGAIVDVLIILLF